MDGYDIIKLQNIAYINAQIVSATMEMEGMKAENSQHQDNQPYGEKQFFALIERYGLGHNSIVTKLNEEL